jgi:hypothetical protein
MEGRQPTVDRNTIETESDTEHQAVHLRCVMPLDTLTGIEVEVDGRQSGNGTPATRSPERGSVSERVDGDQDLENIPEVKEHVDTLLNGLRGEIEARMSTECDDRVHKQLSVILKKMYSFISPDYSERRLALHTASCLLKLSTQYGSIVATGQHEQIMKVGRLY